MSTRAPPETANQLDTPVPGSAAAGTKQPGRSRLVRAVTPFRRRVSHACPPCVQVVKHAQRNWTAFADDNPAVDLMSGHVMLYPIRVHRSGRISARTDSGTFPDAAGAHILPDKIAAPKFPSTLVT